MSLAGSIAAMASIRRRDGDAATNQALSSRLRLLWRCRMSWGTANVNCERVREGYLFGVPRGLEKLRFGSL